MHERTNILHYRLIRKLGEGGMGEVYLAEDTRLRRQVTLKLLPQEFSENEDRISRLQDEARAVSSLNHPNILTIFEVGADEGTHFIAAEYIDGETLRTRLEQPMSIVESLEVTIAIASALIASHEAGIIHRDIKPENVMLRKDGYVKVLDFGLAKLTEREDVTTGATLQKRFDTDPNVIKGTVLYMSPEQLRGLDIDARTDIFSLGIVLYEMITGRAPFRGNSNEVIASILERDPQPLGFLRDDVPVELERIVTKMLRKERRDRYQNARDLRLDLIELKKELEFQSRDSRRSGSFERQRPHRHSSGEIRRGSSDSRRERFSAFVQNRALIGVPFVAIVLVLVFFVVAFNRRSPIDSVAVMPFTNVTADADSEYLSDGITESITHSLSKLPNLRVMARSSVYRYAGDEDARKIGRELNVRAVLLGKLEKKKDTIIVQADLVDTTNGTLIWGDQYTRNVSDLLAVQEDIAREISQKLKVRLTGEDREILARHDTEDAEAYRLYLQGRYFWNKRTPDALKKGIEFFSKAIDRDPNYALAYAGLADSYNMLCQYGGLPPAEAYPAARAAAQRALAIDDSLAEAHTSLGYTKFNYGWDFAGAEAEYRRAIARNPSYATAHHWLALLLAATGRLSEAREEMNRAYELDPLSPVISMNVASLLYLSGMYDEAMKQFQRTAEMDPSFLRVHYEIGRLLEAKGEYDKALAELDKATTVDPLVLKGARARTLALAGRIDEAKKLAAELETQKNAEHFSDYDLAAVYTALGDRDNAFRWLDHAYGRKAGRLAYIRVEPMFRPLHDDPRFSELLRRVGLPPAS